MHGHDDADVARNVGVAAMDSLDVGGHDTSRACPGLSGPFGVERAAWRSGRCSRSGVDLIVVGETWVTADEVRAVIDVVHVGDTAHRPPGIGFAPDGRPLPLSVSVGGAFFERDISFSELFRIADQRLYGVKQNGRNRVDITHASGHPPLGDALSAA